MATYAARRIIQVIPILFVVSVLVFFMLRLLPGDPATYIAGPDATEEALAAVRARMGLDQPIFVQYGLWLGQALTGDFGVSLHTGIPVTELIMRRLPASLELGVAGMLITLLIGIPLGLISGLRPGGILDTLASGFASLALAVPLFWFAILLIMLFSIQLGLLPAGARVGMEAGIGEWLRYLALPAISLGIAHAPFVSRFLRNGILEVMSEDYVRTAYAKGIPRPLIVRRHVVRNSLIPVLTISGLIFGSLLGGVVVTEAVFNWPGLGTLLLISINNRDYGVVQAVLLLVVVIFVLVNLAVDILYGLVDPRIRTARNAN